MRTLYELGELRLDPEAQVLTRSGAPVTLGARAVAVLAALVGRANAYVSKAEIMEAAWSGLVVEEGNLAVQISAIRRALALVGGEGWIETLARRGYRFVGPVVEIAGRQVGPSVPADRAHGNLPQVLTSFIGREREIAEIKRLLPATRLLTLTGAGGIGKTRLAVQAAAEVADAYRDGVRFVDLAPLTDPALVPSAVAQVLGVREAAGQPLLRTLCEHLRSKELLLILDNCEHLLGASADLADTVLRDTARVSVFATSRESLRVAAERVLPLDVLPLPDPKATAASIASSDAVQLFVDRARQHRPRFDLEGSRARAVAEVCVRLDGLPLALELAAARVAVLPVEEIVRLLDQRFRLLTRGGGSELPRQQTLRAMLDWSYELLDPAETELFARLSVFTGGWTVASAKFVGAGEAITQDDVVNLLIALIEKSLVVADENGDRYRMLETVREYAWEKLAANGNAEAVQDRHGRYFSAFGTDEALEALFAHGGMQRIHALRRELDNLLVGCRRAVARADGEVAVACYRAAWEVLALQGPFGVAVGLGDEVLAIRQLDFRLAEKARLTLAEALTRVGTTEGLEAKLEQALDRVRGMGDRKLEARILARLGNVCMWSGRHEEMHSYYSGSLELAHSIGFRLLEARMHGNLAFACQLLDRPDEALAHYDAALAIERAIGSQRDEATTLSNLAYTLGEQGQVDRARATFAAGLALLRQIGDRDGEAVMLQMLGKFELGQGLVDEALLTLRAALELTSVIGNRLVQGHTLRGLGYALLERGEYGDSQSAFEQALAILREASNRPVEANCLAGLGDLASRQGRHGEAAALLGEAEATLRELGERSLLADLLCTRGLADLRRNDRLAAQAALSEAEQLVGAVRTGADAELNRAVERLRAAISG